MTEFIAANDDGDTLATHPTQHAAVMELLGHIMDEMLDANAPGKVEIERDCGDVIIHIDTLDHTMSWTVGETEA